jgi:hypothetical protein
LVENSKGFFAFLTLIATLIVLTGADFREALHWVTDNEGKTMGLIVSYFVIGTVWGIIKWFLYVNRELEKHNEKKTVWLQHQGLKAIETPEQALRFKETFEHGYQLPPQAGSHKSDIMMWMTYWPFSGLWTLINDPVRRVFRTIYTQIAESLQSISNRMFKKAVADFEMAKIAEEAKQKERDAADYNPTRWK